MTDLKKISLTRNKESRHKIVDKKLFVLYNYNSCTKEKAILEQGCKE